MQKKKKFEPFNLVLFGGTGDLAFRKIYPAFYHRILDNPSETEFSIFVIHRDVQEPGKFFDTLALGLKNAVGDRYSEKGFKRFTGHFELIQTPNASKEGYSQLANALNKKEDRQRIYYYSTPSSAFGVISETLKTCGLIKPSSKVVLEKPLGHNLESSVQTNKVVRNSFQEEQIYRIDHYLGKETVQNLMVLRFANSLFERAWNSENIDNVQITVSENLGVEKRAAYYDKSGALRDMVQNHLLQLLCLVAMEPPISLDVNNLRDEKLKVLRALRYFDHTTIQSNTVKGQYTRGKVHDVEVNSYLEDISRYDSSTETFVALKAFVDNWRWKDVPFYLRTGKRMAQRYSDIVINFKPVKHNIFGSTDDMPGNRLIMRLQPEERIELVQMTKIPGPGGYRYKPISLKLDYMDSFNERLPDAYERLIADVIRGNQTLFMRHDELTEAWRWTESVLKNWSDVNAQNVLYASGSWGPGSAIMDGNTTWVNDSSEQ
ncbi:MAG: glucose-6-phosphate dehydrogenase [Bacteroidia bacterium]|nr:glucose-6-phosphate dehydrogenase [Bacteroidia bacterium]